MSKHNYDVVSTVGDNIVVYKALAKRDTHLLGRECPVCNTSLDEGYWYSWIDQNKIDPTRTCSIQCMKVYITCPDLES